MYQNGRGVPQDDTEAAKWYRKAADQGNFPAQLNLGGMYSKGQGVPQDYVQASKWFTLAIAAGPTSHDDMTRRVLYLSSEISRGRLADKMTPEQIAEAQRLAREWKPTN